MAKPPIISASTFKIASQTIQEAVVPLPHQVQKFPRPPAAAPQMQRPPHYFPSPSISGTPMLNRGHLPPPPAPPMAPRMSSIPPRHVPMGMTQHAMPHMQSQMMQHSPMIPSHVAQGPLQGVGSYQLPVVGPAFPGSASAMPNITPAEQKEWESTYTHNEGEMDKKRSNKKCLRVAGTQVWEDSSLSAWDPSKSTVIL